MKKYLALLLLTLTLALPLALPLASAAAPDIVKSPFDDKIYRALTLDNGLKVVLVSDPSTDQAAASLDVHIGNGSDPADWQGLAHFLEHLLFLGNRKYPEAGEYKKFIDDHGGSNNAYTSFAHTNYYFDIAAAHLRPALARFSRFFIDPTFDATFVDRERAVVHSEYQSRRKDEGRRAWSARRQLINPAHPGSRFAVGSEHTLRDRDDITARQKLIAFYERHYSADRMTLAVVGRESLGQLEALVREFFAEVPDRDVDAQRFEQPYLNPQLPPSRLNIAPLQDRLQASFLFPIPSTEAHYRSKPLNYIANLLGHEGEGSLLALLKSLGWAAGLSAGPGYGDQVQGTFEVSIQLTETGLARIDEIGALLFAYIRLVKTAGVEAWRYAEEQKLADIAFRFAEARGAVATARRLAAGLQRYSVEEVLRGPYLMEEYRPQLITSLLDRLVPDNVFLQVIAKGVETDDTTPFYGVDFGIAPIPATTLARWAHGAHGEDGDLDARLALPAPNPFIPERLTAHAFDPNPGPDPALPQPLYAGPGMDAWHHADPQFETPRAGFYFSVASPVAGDNPRNRVLTELFARLVNRQLNVETYPAYLAGLRYELYRHGRGISVRISGYEDQQPLLLETVLAALGDPLVEADGLALVKDELRREWNNAALESPSNQSVHELYRLLIHPYWSEQERLAVLDAIGVDDLKTHAARLLDDIHITVLSHGDVARQRAADMIATLRAAFAGAVWSDAPPRNRVRMLAALAYLRNLDAAHDDSALAVYFQGRGKSHSERAKMRLLARLMESPFFFNLRTTNRVGYVVHAAPLEILEVPGLLFSVQSPTHAPPEINRLINQFLKEFGEILAQMEAPEFNRIKQGLVDRILTREQNLAQRTGRYWREIDRRQFHFDSRRRAAEAIQNLAKAEVVAYFQQVIQNQPHKLMVQSPGRRAGTDLVAGAGYAPVNGAAQFRQTAQSFFPAYP